MVHRVVLPCTAASVPAGRRFVSAVVDELGLQSCRDDAALMTSELLTNSILHRHGDPELVVTWRRTEVEVAVTDRGTWAPRPSSDDAGGMSGRGLHIVERLATGCGVRASGEGTTAWFTLRLAQPAPTWSGPVCR